MLFMHLSFLGHSEFILRIKNNADREISILCDSWLTNHAFGDLFAREPALNADFSELPHLDALWITHPHCDHFDPYSLTEIFRHQRPAIILPVTMAYLEPLLKQYLDNPDIFVLKHGEKVRLFGVNFTGYTFPSPYPTNEDDVMMLFVSNEKEIIFYEGDAAVPLSEQNLNLLYSHFSAHDYSSRLYIATRNELEALFLSYDAEDKNKRKSAIRDYRKKRREEMEWEYSVYEEASETLPVFWNLPHFIKIYVGQGIIFPPEINPDFLKISGAYPQGEVCTDEVKAARDAGFTFGIFAHEPGRSFEIQEGRIVKKEDLSFLPHMKRYPLQYLPDTPVRRVSAAGPLYAADHGPTDENTGYSLSHEEKEHIILDLIRNRFFPSQVIHPEEPLKHLAVSSPKGIYAIEVRYGDSVQFTTAFYTYSFTDMNFHRNDHFRGTPQEMYWADDLIDFFEGRQDLFSHSFNYMDSSRAQRLWTSLGLPFLNSDLVYRKAEYHFRRAAEGKQVSGWVTGILKRNYKT